MVRENIYSIDDKEFVCSFVNIKHIFSFLFLPSSSFKLDEVITNAATVVTSDDEDDEADDDDSVEGSADRLLVF